LSGVSSTVSSLRTCKSMIVKTTSHSARHQGRIQVHHPPKSTKMDPTRSALQSCTYTKSSDGESSTGEEKGVHGVPLVHIRDVGRGTGTSLHGAGRGLGSDHDRLLGEHFCNRLSPSAEFRRTLTIINTREGFTEKRGWDPTGLPQTIDSFRVVFESSFTLLGTSPASAELKHNDCSYHCLFCRCPSRPAQAGSRCSPRSRRG